MRALPSAAELLEEATKKFPDRLDIWCGLAFTFQEMGNFDSELSILQKMVAYAREHLERLRWLKGEELPEPPERFVPEKLHSYGMYSENKENPEDDKRLLKLATFTAEQLKTNP